MNRIIGLGGRDMAVADFVEIVGKARKALTAKPSKDYEIYGVRGS